MPNTINLKIEIFLIIIKKGTTLMGCYSSGGSHFDTLIDGLSQSQVASINSSSIWLTLNNNYLFELSTGMTNEKCNNICKQFNFLYAGLEWG